MDELGYLRLDPESSHLFFQIVARRYERGSILMNNNRVVGERGTVFGDPVVATVPSRPDPNYHKPRLGIY